ncbi:Gp19/Gp15/Gp42 family protein [uncultured Corynebacterium sp.]|uniref:Gp19/Gp15/Gp42 family protein n=1 Tax=uncultured Corynebacterium sp. TaxID=159447 RepID=UPI00262679BD|nr:Gp19/Gp15/Gp42 family protein [uncultured Corynebacterium sp.]
MAIASFEDVEVRFFRDLTAEERPLVESRLADAENKIRRRIPDLDDRIVDDPAFAGTVVRVCADAVIRLVRNPEGYVQETDGNYTYMLSHSSADGRLTILPEEWADLGVRKKIQTFLAMPTMVREDYEPSRSW